MPAGAPPTRSTPTCSTPARAEPPNSWRPRSSGLVNRQQTTVTRPAASPRPVAVSAAGLLDQHDLLAAAVARGGHRSAGRWHLRGASVAWTDCHAVDRTARVEELRAAWPYGPASLSTHARMDTGQRKRRTR